MSHALNPTVLVIAVLFSSASLFPRRAIAFVARRFYEEPYTAIPTSHSIELTTGSLNVNYAWKLGARWHTLSVAADPTPEPITPASEEEFITEHYWGYTKRAEGSTSAYEVQHPRWQTYPVTHHEIDADFATLYGPTFTHLNHAQLANVLLTEGSAVSVHSGIRL
jgi:hypothetical protein